MQTGSARGPKADILLSRPPQVRWSAATLDLLCWSVYAQLLLPGNSPKDAKQNPSINSVTSFASHRRLSLQELALFCHLSLCVMLSSWTTRWWLVLHMTRGGEGSREVWPASLCEPAWLT